MASIKAIASVLNELQAVYSQNWQPLEEETVKVWKKYLSDDSISDADLQNAVENYVKTSGTYFPPMLPQLLDAISKHKASKSSVVELETEDGKVIRGYY